jgi:hypothetical protein
MSSQFSREGGYQPWTSDMAGVSESLELGDFFVRVAVRSMELRRTEHWKPTALEAIPMTIYLIDSRTLPLRCLFIVIGTIT